MPGGGSGPQGTFGSDMGADFFSGGMQMPDMGAFGGFGQSDRINQEAVTLSLDDVDDLEEEEYKLVRRKKFPIKPMMVEEAELQMDMLGHDF